MVPKVRVPQTTEERKALYQWLVDRGGIRDHESVEDLARKATRELQRKVTYWHLQRAIKLYLKNETRGGGESAKEKGSDMYIANKLDNIQTTLNTILDLVKSFIYAHGYQDRSRNMRDRGV